MRFHKIIINHLYFKFQPASSVVSKRNTFKNVVNLITISYTYNMVDRNEVLVRLTQRKAGNVLKETNNLGMGILGKKIESVLKENHGFGLACFKGLELAVSAYNSVVITRKNKDLLKASAKLKLKIPCLPLPSEVFHDIDLKRQRSSWAETFTQALDNLEEKISRGSLEWYKTETNNEALAAAGVTHEYEEKVIIDANSRGKQEFKIDEVVDVVMEMLMWKCRDTQLYSWLCNNPSTDLGGGMGWADSYDHLSDKLRKQAGFL